MSSDFYSCKVSSDCELVKDGYCLNFSAVNKKLISKWKSFEKKETESAIKAARTCVTLPSLPKIEDYKVECVQNNCRATRTKPW